MRGNGPTVRCARLSNGVRIVTETMPGVAAATLGIWVENGSRYERREQAGISHFLEHLFFKGTSRRTAADIAEAFDAVGGHFNAFTGREHTCYYGKVLGEHLPIAQDVLADILRNSRFEEEEIDRERSVIVQEILQSEDTPDDHVHDLFLQQYWPGHPLGFPIHGSVATVESFRRADFLGFVEQRYRPDRLLVAAAGNIEHDAFAAWAEGAFGDLTGTTDLATSASPTPQAGVRCTDKDLEQVHICIGMPGIEHTSPLRYPAYLLNSALGGGMSSRLFQEIREKRGRAYSVYSFLSPYSDAGYLGVYIGTSAEHVQEVIETTLTQLEDLRRNGLRDEEFARVKNQLKGNLLLGLETSDSRMHRIARDELLFGRSISLDEVAAQIDAATADEILEAAGHIARRDSMAVTILGRLGEPGIDDSILA